MGQRSSGGLVSKKKKSKCKTLTQKGRELMHSQKAQRQGAQNWNDVCVRMCSKRHLGHCGKESNWS